MQKIKNKNYRNFLDNGIIETLNEDHINQALSNIKHRHQQEARALLIALYYTGGRPVEVLQMVGKDIQKQNTYITVKLKAAKKGLPRVMYLPAKRPLVKELYNYAASLLPDMLLFYHFRSTYKRPIKKDGFIQPRAEIAAKIRYNINKWFNGVIEDSIPPYYIRHNRFSKLSIAGARLEDIRMIKGCKTVNSVMPYLHLSSHSAKKICEKID